MRIDKLTTKFQEALAEAQTLALTHDNAFIEPVHVLAAMIRTDDAPKALMNRAGVNVAGLLASAEAGIKRLPQVQGHEQVTVGRDMVSLLQAGRERSHQTWRPVHCRRTVFAGRGRPQGRRRANGPHQRPDPQEPGEPPSTPCAAARRWTVRTPKTSANPSRNTAST